MMLWWYADRNVVKSRSDKTVCTVPSLSFEDADAVAQLIAELPELIGSLQETEELLAQLYQTGLSVEHELLTVREKLDKIKTMLNRIKYR